MAGAGLEHAVTGAAAGLSLRPENEEDLPFLLQLYVSVRWPELAPTGWADSQKTAFLGSQFALQRNHFARHFAGADFYIIDIADSPIGRMAVDRRHSERLHLLDVALLPSWRGKGIGSALIRTLIVEAGTRPFSLNVVSENPARRLYRRLGLHEVKAEGFHVFMETRPV